MRLFLSGPMTGIPLFNWPEFDRWTAILRAEGNEVWSPAENDRAKGIDPNDRITQAQLYELVRDDLRALVDCEGIALMPGWQRSTGARRERDAADWCGLRVVYLEDRT